jgi:hypothetical protein
VPRDIHTFTAGEPRAYLKRRAAVGHNSKASQSVRSAISQLPRAQRAWPVKTQRSLRTRGAAQRHRNRNFHLETMAAHPHHRVDLHDTISAVLRDSLRALHCKRSKFVLRARIPAALRGATQSVQPRPGSTQRTRRAPRIAEVVSALPCWQKCHNFSFRIASVILCAALRSPRFEGHNRSHRAEAGRLRRRLRDRSFGCGRRLLCVLLNAVSSRMRCKSAVKGTFADAGC